MVNGVFAVVLSGGCRKVLMKPWSDAGCFHELETLDLRDVFCASQPGDETNQTTLASIVRGTGG